MVDQAHLDKGGVTREQNEILGHSVGLEVLVAEVQQSVLLLDEYQPAAGESNERR